MWNSELTNALLQIRDEALIKNNNGDCRQLVAIVHEEWRKLFPLSKASIGSLKIKLSKLNRLGKHKEATDHHNVLSSALIMYHLSNNPLMKLESR